MIFVVVASAFFYIKPQNIHQEINVLTPDTKPTASSSGLQSQEIVDSLGNVILTREEVVNSISEYSKPNSLLNGTRLVDLITCVLMIKAISPS